MTLRNWLLPFCTGAAGLIAGLILGRNESVDDVAVAAGPPAMAIDSGQNARPSGGSAVSLEDIRRVVREELAAQVAAHGAMDDASLRRAPGESASTPPSRQQVVAAAQAQALLDGAIARRQWTDDDARALRAQIHELSPDQQTELLRQYSVAVNQGRLVPETDQAPF